MTTKSISPVALALVALGAAAVWVAWSRREPALGERTRQRLR